MNRNAVHSLLTTLCCIGMLMAAGCSNAGEMSVTGFYDSRSSRLAGECDDIMMEAAEAEGDEKERLKDEYRACVEDALEEGGHDGKCAEDRDPTCDIILDELGDTIDALREDRGDEPPNCDAPASAGDEALCHLMAAYETCQLDHDGDGEPDVDERDDGEDSDDGDHERDGDKEDDEHHGDREADDGDGSGLDDKSCEDVRRIHSEVGPEDQEFLERERPDCFDDAAAGDDSADGESTDDESTDGEKESTDGESTDGETSDGETSDGEHADGDAFCEELEQDIATADANGEEDKEAELREVFERECVI